MELAKALLHQPRVLLLDEPSTGLDPAARASVMDYLHRLRDEEGVTCLITTHLMDEADRCDSIAILDSGKLVTKDTPERLKQTIQVPLMKQVFTHRELNVQAGALEYDAQHLAHAPAVCHNVSPGDAGGSAGRYGVRRQNAKERGLAASVGAQQSQDGCRGNVELDGIQSGSRTVAVG